MLSEETITGSAYIYTSFRTGDEGWRWQNGWFDYTPPTNPLKVAALDFIDKIERKILSIVENIANRTPLEIIKIRIKYVRNLVENTPEFVEAYDEFNQTILDIIDMITYKIDFPSIIKSIQTLQASIAEAKPETELMAKIQRLILSIIDNIITRTPLEIVKTRVKYLRKLVEELVAMDEASTKTRR
jgi:hypothetical protein